MLAVLAMARAEPPTFDIIEDDPGRIELWIIESWKADGARLLAASAFKGALDLKVSFQVEPAPSRDGPKGTLSISALTVLHAPKDATIHIDLIGRGWLEDSATGRRLLRQNLAHEIAHLAQKQRYDSAFESALLHEGYAEAQALDLMVEARFWGHDDRRQAIFGLEQRCLEALREGPLAPQIEARKEDATYACGAVLILAAADRAGMSVHQLHQHYAHTMKTPHRLGVWLKETLGRNFMLLARRFIEDDHRFGANPMIEDLRAGRL